MRFPPVSRQAVGRSMLLDEVLTMSARMASATGDFSYDIRNHRLTLTTPFVIFKTVPAAH
jgi:hypothetical protein